MYVYIYIYTYIYVNASAQERSARSGCCAKPRRSGKGRVQGRLGFRVTGLGYRV